MPGNTSLWVGHLSQGQRKEGQEGDPGHCCPKVWWLLNLVVLVADHRVTPGFTVRSGAFLIMLQCCIGWDDEAREVNWDCVSPPRTYWSSPVWVCIGHPTGGPVAHLCASALPSSGHWNALSVLLGVSGKPTHRWELAFCSIWFHLRDVDCPK